MKKYIFIILVLSYSIFAQDKEPGQHKFNFLGIEQYLSADSSYFKQDDYLLGVQWGSRPRIAKALLCNQIDCNHSDTNTNKANNNTMIILQHNDRTHSVGGEILNARGIEYSPVTKIDPNEPEKLVKRAGDTTRRCFGYKYIRGKISNNPTDSFYNSLVVGGDSLVNQVILAEPWPSNQLNTKGSDLKSPPPDSIINKYLCKTLYFNINLRRLGNDEMTNDTILKIELPYSYLYDSLYLKPDSTIAHITVSRYNNIQFSSIPFDTQHPYNRDNYIDTSRGFYKDTIHADTGCRAFYITKQMLPLGSSNNNITLSAFFICDGNTDLHNLRLKSSDPKYKQIDSIKIKITYLGDCTIAINNTSITTPHTRLLLSGKYDDTLTKSVQSDLNKFSGSEYINKNIRLFRYITVVEGFLQQWLGEKYFNKLIGNISCSETGIFFPAHYEYYVNAPSRWFGIYKLLNHVSAPYSKRSFGFDSSARVKTMGLRNGYSGFNSWPENGNYVYSPSESHYETYLFDASVLNGRLLPINTFLVNPNNITLYESVMNIENNWGKASLQACYENTIYGSFIVNNSNRFLFSEVPWWHQGFTHTKFDNEDNTGDSLKPQAFYLIRRPFSSEEYNLFAYIGIIIGAKGLIYDGIEMLYTYNKKPQLYNGTYIPEPIRTPLEALQDSSFLYSEVSGSDFFSLDNEIARLDTAVYNFDTIANYQDRPKGKIYLGRKSLRLATRQLHEWCTANSDLLMRLRLVCWYDKGYRINYLQDSARYGSATILSQFIDTSLSSASQMMLDTSRFKSKVDIATTTPHTENWDSTFIDISILRLDTDSLLNSNQIFMGVLNRRTSPLILEDSTLNFYSSAEFETNCKNGGYTNDSTWQNASWWQSKYWQRAGVREFSIPMNYTHNNIANNSTKQYYLLS